MREIVTIQAGAPPAPGERVAVALSGGGDSLLALALVREAKAKPLGLHAFLSPPDDAAGQTAAKLESLCATLGVPFTAVDLSREFEELVVAPFVAAYRAGLTPNPCAACNPAIKFGLLLDKACSLGADRLATGHYARLSSRPDGGPVLWRGTDRSRDQSYFLAFVPGQRLARAIFPLADTLKKDVPAGLAARGLAPPLPKESREICFIPGDDYRAFLESRGEMPGSGEIVFADGRPAGRHQGLWRHTVGQRKGLGLSHPEPLYVLAKDAAANRLVAGTRDELLVTRFSVTGGNFPTPPPVWPQGFGVQTHYRQGPVPVAAMIPAAHDAWLVTTAAPLARPAPGQAAVFYSGEEVLGGAWIAPGGDENT